MLSDTCVSIVNFTFFSVNCVDIVFLLIPIVAIDIGASYIAWCVTVLVYVVPIFPVNVDFIYFNSSNWSLSYFVVIASSSISFML